VLITVLQCEHVESEISPDANVGVIAGACDWWYPTWSGDEFPTLC